MDGIWLTSYIALWVLVSLLTIIVAGLVRQLGLTYVRLGSEDNLLVTQQGLEVGTQAPDFHAYDIIHDQEITLTNLKGRLSVLVFISPSCMPCHELMPHLASFYRSRKRKVNLVLISQAEPRYSLELAQTYKLTIPLLSDFDSSISTAFQVHATPFAYSLEADGRIRHRGVVNQFDALVELLTDVPNDEPKIALPSTEPTTTSVYNKPM